MLVKNFILLFLTGIGPSSEQRALLIELEDRWRQITTKLPGSLRRPLPKLEELV